MIEVTIQSLAELAGKKEPETSKREDARAEFAKELNLVDVEDDPYKRVIDKEVAIATTQRITHCIYRGTNKQGRMLVSHVVETITNYLNSERGETVGCRISGGVKYIPLGTETDITELENGELERICGELNTLYSRNRQNPPVTDFEI